MMPAIASFTLMEYTSVYYSCRLPAFENINKFAVTISPLLNCRRLRECWRVIGIKQTRNVNHCVTPIS